MSPKEGLTKPAVNVRHVVLQIIQIVLAVPIVVAFATVQLGMARPRDLGYLLTNLICSGGLALIAARTFQLGFVITNCLWVVVSASGLVTLARQRLRP